MGRTTSHHSYDVRDRAVRSFPGDGGQHGLLWQPVMPISATIGCVAQALKDQVMKVQVNSGRRRHPARADEGAVA